MTISSGQWTELKNKSGHNSLDARYLIIAKAIGHERTNSRFRLSEMTDKEKSDWIRGVINSMDIILIAIHSNFHWRLGVIANTRKDHAKCVSYYTILDSLSDTGRTKDEDIQRMKYTLQGVSWTTNDQISNLRSNKQRNGIDCGVFLAANALQITINKSISTDCLKTEQEARQFKDRLAIDLARGETYHTLTWLTGTKKTPCKLFTPTVAGVRICKCGHDIETHQKRTKGDIHQSITWLTTAHQRKKPMKRKHIRPTEPTLESHDTNDHKQPKTQKPKITHNITRTPDTQRQLQKRNKEQALMTKIRPSQAHRTNFQSDLAGLEQAAPEVGKEHKYNRTLTNIMARHLHLDRELNTTAENKNDNMDWWSPHEHDKRFGAQGGLMKDFLKHRSTWTNLNDTTIEAIVENAKMAITEANDEEQVENTLAVENLRKKAEKQRRKKENEQKNTKHKKSKRHLQHKLTGWVSQRNIADITVTNKKNKHSPLRLAILTNRDLCSEKQQEEPLNFKMYTLITIQGSLIPLKSDPERKHQNNDIQQDNTLRVVIIESLGAPKINIDKLLNEIQGIPTWGHAVRTATPPMGNKEHRSNNTLDNESHVLTPIHLRPSLIWYRSRMNLTKEESKIETDDTTAYNNMSRHSNILALLGISPKTLEQDLKTMGHSDEEANKNSIHQINKILRDTTFENYRKAASWKNRQRHG